MPSQPVRQFIRSLTPYCICCALVAGCGSAPDPRPVTPVTPEVVEAPEIYLAAGVAPAIARQDGAETIETSTRAVEDTPAVEEPRGGTSLLQITDIAEQTPLPDPIIVKTTAEPVVVETTAQPMEEPPIEEQPAPPPIVAETVVEPQKTTPPRQDGTASSEKETQISATLPIDTLEKLVLMSGPGSLTVTEDPDRSEIVFSADVVIRAAGLQRARQLTDAVRIAIDRPTGIRPRVRIVEPALQGSEECLVHLTVQVPAGATDRFSFDIQDSHGDIAFHGYRGPLSITSLHGAIEVIDGAGELDISSGSGPCSVTGYEGNVKIRDGAGNCSIGQISGNVEVWGKAGSLEIRYISGNVRAIDGRNGITVQSIEGNLTMYGIPLGDSTIEGVSGSVMSKTGAP